MSKILRVWFHFRSGLWLLGMLLVSCQIQSEFRSTPVMIIEEQGGAGNSGLMTGEFVTSSDGQFWLDGQPYYFAGANFWQCMNLGSSGPGGDRGRLATELDNLQALGITNLRVAAASEGPNTEPYRLDPALMVEPGVYDDEVLAGLDFCLAEIGKRGMRAVMILNNFWYWSGGMAQYVAWDEGGKIPYPGEWEAYMIYTSRFYRCEQCQIWFRNHVEMLVNRKNVYSGVEYRADPAIFSWELANEPRRYPQTWVDGMAGYIKSLDPNHMVTTGSEGAPPGEVQDFVRTHSGPDIDYATVHIWPQNWGWFSPEEPASYATAEERALEYFRQHAYDAAVLLDKPLVLEEFGLARDWQPLLDNLDPRSSTLNRDRFYQAMFAEVLALMEKGGPAAGDNFWAWSGSARPGAAWVGDPPHEAPGWYSVYDADKSTLAIIASHAEAIRQLQK